jgi:hypothetical protein
LTTHNAGAKIGTTFIGAPTVADGIALISFTPTDLQCALDIVANETTKDKVTINSSKSAVVIYNANKQREKQEWKLGENKIEEVDSTTYIANFRELRGKNDIESRIKKGRSTSYALLEAGLQGENGINPYISYKLYTTFCRPRMIYGLEAVQLLEGEKLELLKYERKLLEQLQGLPEKCHVLHTCSLVLHQSLQSLRKIH